ncbi:MAG: TetR/AcrR family transcriptional regulator [Sandaracinaceae bacterium]
MAKVSWTKEHFLELQRQLLGEDVTSKDHRRARILKAATELFMVQGYKKTSVDEIARRAEVAKGTVYLHFENKSDLLLHAIALEKQVLFTKLAPLFEGTLEEEKRLRFFVGAMLTVGRDLPLVARLMSGDNELLAALGEWDPSILLVGRAAGEAWVAQLIEEAAPGEHDAEERRRRASALQTLQWFVVQLLDERVRGNRPLDEVAETLADVLVYGLVNRPPEADADEDEPPDEEG